MNLDGCLKLQARRWGEHESTSGTFLCEVNDGKKWVHHRFPQSALSTSVPQKILQGIPSRRLAGVFGPGTFPFAPDKIKPFTEVAYMLFRNWLSAAITTLMRHCGIVINTVQANAHIGAAPVTAFATTGISTDGVFPTTFVTMSRQFAHGSEDSNPTIPVMQTSSKTQRFFSRNQISVTLLVSRNILFPKKLYRSTNFFS